jgi:hypothetical protein
MSCPVVEINAGELLISKRPFAVAKWSAWLVLKESPLCLRLQAQLYSNLLKYLTPLSCCCLLTDGTQKTLRLQTPSVPNIVGRRNKCAKMSEYGQVGSAKNGQWAATSPWILQYDLYYFTLGVHFTQGHIMTNVSHTKIDEISTKVCD